MIILVEPNKEKREVELKISTASNEQKYRIKEIKKIVEVVYS